MFRERKKCLESERDVQREKGMFRARKECSERERNVQRET